MTCHMWQVPINTQLPNPDDLLTLWPSVYSNAVSKAKSDQLECKQLCGAEVKSSNSSESWIFKAFVWASDGSCFEFVS